MAAPVLTPQQLNDLNTTTLRDLGRGKITEIATDLQDFVASRNLLNKNRIDIQSGTGISWNAKVAQSGAAANVGLGANDNIDITDTQTTATCDWRNTVTSWALIGQELSMNKTPAQIVDLQLSRKLDAMIALAEVMEANFWGPPVDITDSLTPWGINTWLVKSATEGFTGGAPSGYTTIGLNPTTYPRWKHWAFPYTTVTKDDFVRKMRNAATKTTFKPPVDGIPTYNTGDTYGFYTNYAVIGLLEEALESQNENLGNDIASKDGMSLFRRVPFTWVPKLEADTTNPIYGLNWGWMKTIILNGWWLRPTFIPIYPGQHTVSANFLDSTYNFVTRNRRCHFVGSTGTSYPA